MIVHHRYPLSVTKLIEFLIWLTSAYFLKKRSGHISLHGTLSTIFNEHTLVYSNEYVYAHMDTCSRMFVCWWLWTVFFFLLWQRFASCGNARGFVCVHMETNIDANMIVTVVTEVVAIRLDANAISSRCHRYHLPLLSSILQLLIHASGNMLFLIHFILISLFFLYFACIRSVCCCLHANLSIFHLNFLS